MRKISNINKLAKSSSTISEFANHYINYLHNIFQSIDKSQLQSDLNLTIDEKENLANENIKLQNSLKEQDEKFEVTNQKNRSFERA